MRKLITWAAIVGAVFVAAIVMISYAVATHTEPVWLWACTNVAGAAVYTEPVEGGNGGGGSTCEDPRPVRWRSSDFPLHVRVSSARGELTEDDREAVVAALDGFSLQAGFQVFSFPPGVSMPEVSVVLHVPAASGAPAASVRHWLRDDGTITAAMVEVGNTPDDATLHLVLLHESGHVVGLAHDDWQGSLMAAGTLDGGIPGRPLPRLTDTDRDELRTVYLPL